MLANTPTTRSSPHDSRFNQRKFSSRIFRHHARPVRVARAHRGDDVDDDSEGAAADEDDDSEDETSEGGVGEAAEASADKW